MSEKEEKKETLEEEIEASYPEKKQPLAGCKLHPMGNIGEPHQAMCVEEITQGIIEDAREIEELWRKHDLGCAYIKQLGLSELGEKLESFKQLFKEKLGEFLDSKLACIKKLEEMLSKGEIDPKTFVIVAQKFGLTKDGNKETEVEM